MDDRFPVDEPYVRVRVWMPRETAQQFLDGINIMCDSCPPFYWLPRKHWDALAESLIIMRRICELLLEYKEEGETIDNSSR